MIKNIIFGDRQFESKKALFHSLKDNEETIIGLKKAKAYKSIDKGQGLFNVPIANKSNTIKTDLVQGFIYPAINSTNWLDSHQDVHLKGCYTRTVKEQQGRVYYIDTHLKGLNNIITRKNNIEMFYDDVEWSLLNKDLKGTTEALFFKIAEENVKADYLQLIKEDKELQNSLAMMYKDIVMCVNSNDSEFKENKEYFDAYIEGIGNKDKALHDEVFFAVKELAIMGEGSLCPVVGGSNSATSVVIGTKAEKSPETIEAEKSLQRKKDYLLNLNK